MSIDLIGHALALTNAVFAGLAMAYQIEYFRRYRCQPWCWLKLAKCLVASYWMLLYGYIAIFDTGSMDAGLFGLIFVRPAFTVTIGIMAAAAIYRKRSSP